MPVALLMQQLLGAPPERGNAMLSHRYACYNTYETADGRFMAVGCVEPRFWEALCRFLELPQFISLQYDDTRREEILAAFQATFKEKTLAEWELAIGERDICCSAVRRLDEALEDRLFVEREMVPHLAKRDEPPVLAIGTPVKLSQTPGAVRSCPVSFGKNTIAILKELGYADDAIARMRRSGII